MIYNAFFYILFYNLALVSEKNGWKMNVDHRSCSLKGLMKIEV